MKRNSKIEKASAILRKVTMVLLTMAVVLPCMTNSVFAADPLSTINSLSDVIFSAIKAIGFILLGFGVVQIVEGIKGGLQAIGYGLLVLFFQ